VTGVQVSIVPRHDLSITDIDYLEDRLYDHNSRATGSNDGRRLAFAAMDARRAEIGWIAGYSWAGMAEIKQLWVHEAHRGRGLAAEVAQQRCYRGRSSWLPVHLGNVIRFPGTGFLREV
jgi:hypothetical protein